MNDNIENLKKLWTQRFKVLMEADRLLGTTKFKDLAHAYLQCADELEKPPLDLLKQYEPCEPNVDSMVFKRLVKEQIEKDHARLDGVDKVYIKNKTTQNHEH